MAISGGLSVLKRDRGLELKTQEFRGFLKQLRTTLGNKTTMQRVVDTEVAKVLERTIELTGKADREKIKIRVKNRSVFRVDGRKWTTRNYKTGQAWHVPNGIWAKIEDIRSRSLARKLAKIGLSKQSWYLLAQKLGFEVKAPGYVKAATSSAGGEGNVSIQREVAGDRYGVMIRNAMPILKYSPPAGREAFFSALAGRINFFKMNVAKGVFDSVRATAAKYKGVLVR